MGREARRVNKELTEWYAPDIEGNRADPEPFEVLLSPVSGADMLKARQASAGAVLRGKGAEQAAGAGQALFERLIADYVIEVRRYAVTDIIGDRIEPRNGAELVDAIKTAGPSELAILDDIAGRLILGSGLGADALKKSAAQSDTSGPETSQQKTGSALTAPAKTPTRQPSSEATSTAASADAMPQATA